MAIAIAVVITSVFALELVGLHYTKTVSWVAISKDSWESKSFIMGG